MVDQRCLVPVAAIVVGHTLMMERSQDRAIAGVRCLYWSEGRADLHGVHGEPWVTSAMEARCRRCTLPLSNPACSCGVGLCASVEWLGDLEYLRDCDAPYLAVVRAWGRVSGDLEDGPGPVNCLRAQHVAIVALASVTPSVAGERPADAPPVELLARQLGVSVVAETAVEALIRASGDPWPHDPRLAPVAPQPSVRSVTR